MIQLFISRIKNVSFFVFFLFNTNLSAQITVENTLTAQHIVENVLLGQGITVSNITLNGSAINAQSTNPQIGTFSKGSSTFPINSGVILSTGRVQDVPGNAATFRDSQLGTNVSDPDLLKIVQSISSSIDINDAIVLEFDFEPSGDSLSFDYCFASEEYPQFANSPNYNDVFGFFISGPGFNGPYSNNSTNIALIPTTTTGSNNVSINNINNGTENDICKNCMYYVDNSSNIYGSSVTFNGMTTVLTAVGNLQCGETYHIKLAIGDATDERYDSGVFLKARSFSTNSLNLSTTSDYNSTIVDTLVQEGCTSNKLMLVRPSSDTLATYKFEVSGTADASDFNQFSDSIVFNIGQDTAYITLDPINDGLAEGTEWIKYKYLAFNTCGEEISDSTIIYITDKYDLSYNLTEETTTNCPNVDPTISISNVQNSIGPYSFTWENNEVNNTTTFINTGVNKDSTYFKINVTDGCSNDFIDSVLIINDYDKSVFNILPNDTVVNTCPSQNLSATIEPVNNTYAPYTYLWSNGENTSSVTNLTNGGLDGEIVTYYVDASNICGMTTRDSVKIINDFSPPQLTTNSSPLEILCLDDSVLINLEVVGGTQPYTFTWSDGFISSNNTRYLVDSLGINNSLYNYSVYVDDDCGRSSTPLVGTYQTSQTLEVDLTSISSSYCISDGEINSIISGENGSANYNWTGGNISNPTLSNQENLSSGWYYLSLQDQVCTITDSIFIGMTDSIIPVLETEKIVNPSSTPIFFENLSQNGVDFSWNFGNNQSTNSTDLNNVSSSYSSKGFYTVTLIAFNGPCSETDSITIEIIEQPILVKKPNVITPNNDGLNDIFELEILYADEISLTITNRWGNIVFQETSTNPKWNGNKNNGDELSSGTYFFKFKATNGSGENLEDEGFIQLIKN